MMSDHDFVHSKLGFPRPNLSVKTVTYRKIKDIDLAAFNFDLSSICDELLDINDINVLATQYNRLLGECLDKHAPVLSKTCVVRPKVPWYSDTLKEMKQTRRKLERKYRNTDSDSDYDRFRLIRNRYANMLTQAHREHYESEIMKAKGNQKKLFSIIQELTSVKRETPLPDHTCIKELANNFGDFFIKKIENIHNKIDSQQCTFQDRSTRSLPETMMS